MCGVLKSRVSIMLRVGKPIPSPFQGQYFRTIFIESVDCIKAYSLDQPKANIGISHNIRSCFAFLFVIYLITATVRWSLDWQLKFNSKKCKHLRIGKNILQSKFYMTNEQNIREKIGQVKEEKDPGVQLDEHLTFSHHISEKIKMANRSLGIIKRTFTYMESDINCVSANVIIRSKIELSNVYQQSRQYKDRTIKWILSNGYQQI